MLRKLKRIKNLGVFSDYTWDPALPPFERFNVVYGDNGSGKTTLSRLLAALNVGSISDAPALDYTVEAEEGDLTSGTQYSVQVRVFNSDYVQSNIGMLEGPLKPILVIGEENKAVAQELEIQAAELTARKAEMDAAEREVTRLQSARGKLFTEIAKTVSEATSGSAVRSYRKNNAESAYSELQGLPLLSEDELDQARTTIRQEELDHISTLERPTIVAAGSLSTLENAGQILTSHAKELCTISATAAAIERLQQHPEIAAWVETGHILHKTLGSTECEFCGQDIPQARWDLLAAHFNSEDEFLKDQIVALLNELDRAAHSLRNTRFPDKMALYSELRAVYADAYDNWTTALNQAISQFEALQNVLKDKLTSRSRSISCDSSIDLAPLGSTYDALMSFINQHNKKSDRFEDEKAAARRAIEAHYLSTIAPDVVDFDRKIEAEEARIVKCMEGDGSPSSLNMVALGTAIEAKRATISSAHQAGAKLTELLHTFLGRSDLVFDSEENGYRVTRNGKPATRLSEGERTAIAFIYFVVQLGDRDFKIDEGLVVIDDPISSLDSGAVFQAFAFLKNAVKDAKQVFLLTHNFSFLRLVLNWLQNLKNKGSKKQFYMLVCMQEAAGRSSSIRPLDKALVDHPSEYHFLFKVLANLETDGTIASCYHVPNVARKVLETFLDFHVPMKGSLYGKLQDVDFDENKKTAIYKFSNDLSHFTGQGFEPGLVQETQKNAKYLLEMIEKLAPEHYAGMKAASAQ